MAKLWTKEGILAPKSIQHLCHLNLGSYVTWQAELNANKTCMPNQVCQNNFCHSILTQLKFPLAVLSVSSIGTFLQEEIKLGFILSEIAKKSHKGI